MELREIRLVHIFPGYYMSGDGAKRGKVRYMDEKDG